MNVKKILVNVLLGSVLVSGAWGEETVSAGEEKVFSKHNQADTWEKGLKTAKNRIRKQEQDRLNAALRALELAAYRGVPLDKIEGAISDGLKAGFGPLDFEPLGKSVTQLHNQGLKGQELADAIHQEIKQRKEIKDQAKEQKRAKKDQKEEDKKTDKDKGKDKDKNRGKDKNRDKDRENEKGWEKDKEKDKDEQPGKDKKDKDHGNKEKKGKQRGQGKENKNKGGKNK